MHGHWPSRRTCRIIFLHINENFDVEYGLIIFGKLFYYKMANLYLVRITKPFQTTC